MSYFGHIKRHVNQTETRQDHMLHVIGVVSNPVRYQSRYRIAREWIEHMLATQYVKLTVVEAAFGDRHFEIDKQEMFKEKYDVLRFYTKSPAWIKESLINLAFRHVVTKYPKARYFAWIDMDVFFRDPCWDSETIHQLQHYEVLQPWSDALDLGPSGEVLKHHKSFAWKLQRHQGDPSCFDYSYAHTGYAWACTRSFIEKMWGAGGASGPLMDWAILGSADHHMAQAMVGRVKKSINGLMHPNFFKKCQEWETRAMKATNTEVGYQKGRIEHMFHGAVKNRYYVDRWQILVDHKYDPDAHLTHDDQGLAMVVGNKKLEQEIHRYNLSRCEDSIDTEDEPLFAMSQGQKKIEPNQTKVPRRMMHFADSMRSMNFAEPEVTSRISSGRSHRRHGGGPVHDDPDPYPNT